MPDQGSERIDVHDGLRLLRRHWLLILACGVLLGVAALAMALSQPKQYTAGASLLFRDPAFDQTLFGSTFLGGSKDPDRQAATNVALVGMTEVARRTAARSDVDLTPRQVRDALVIEPNGRSDVVIVKATLGQRAAAAAVANGFAAEFVNVRREADQETVRNAQRLVERQLAQLKATGDANSPQAKSLGDRAEQLSVLGSLQTGNVELVQRADLPTGPSAPRPRRNAAIGFLLGALLGIGLVFLRDRFDRRLRTVDSLAEGFGSPVLTRVPVTGSFVRGLPPARSLTEEAFSTLWTNLRYFNVTRGIDSVLVTSPTSGDGKSMVALNLAAAAARGGSRVLIVETDLRRPSLARVIAATPARGGLTQVLAGTIPFAQAIVKTPAYALTDAKADRRDMDVLVAGPIPPNPAEMLDSDAMRQILQDAREQYDLVIIDTPPMLVVPDAIPLLGQVSAVLVVGRLGATNRDTAAELKTKLAILDAPLVGVVANYAPEAGADYYYYRSSDLDGAVDEPASASSGRA